MLRSGITVPYESFIPVFLKRALHTAFIEAKAVDTSINSGDGSFLTTPPPILSVYGFFDVCRSN